MCSASMFRSEFRLNWESLPLYVATEDELSSTGGIDVDADALAKVPVLFSGGLYLSLTDDRRIVVEHC